MTLVNGKTREKIVGYDIARDRSLRHIQNLIDNTPKAEFYFSDAFPVYSQICYEGVYRALNNKSQTFTLESVNADLRHYIPPLHRKSRCFFRSFDTIFVVFKIFVLAFNKYSLAKLRFNILNIISLFPRFYLDFSCQLLWGTLFIKKLLTYNKFMI